ncbi:hypothetical protein [Azonexus sp.]|uniref:hypothetical protein n=1 Tax=Azonexus sp. TaxID=1872668 RepID=UPI0035B17CC4
MKTTLIAALIACLAACNYTEEKAVAPAARAEPSIPSAPNHFYVMQDGMEYGYEQAISQEALQQGQAASKIMMVKFIGERNGVLQMHTKDGEVHIVFQCERPCEFVKQMLFIDGQLMRKEHLRANEGSLVWAIAQDVQAGRLIKFTRLRNGKPQETWFDENGPSWRPVSN